MSRALAFLGSVILCWIARPEGRAMEPDPPSARAQMALRRALAAIEASFDLGLEAPDVTKAAKDLDQALDQLALSIDAGSAERLSKSEVRSMEAKLVAIAWDRRLHPKVYRELRFGYQPGVGPSGAHVASQPPPKKEHLTESYRLAWEYCLLNPGTQGVPGRGPEPPLQALQQIGNPASIPTLVYCFRHACRKQ